MVQLDFVPWKGFEEAKQPRFMQNKYECARGEIERHHAAGHGGLHAGRVGGAWREPLPLYNHCEGENDAPELCGAEECE